jgi:NhaA family Na+:H+ antiporter
MILFILNMTGVRSFIPFALIGFILWICVLKSGVHATLAGVAVATAIPLRNNKDPKHSLLRELEHALHPWVAFAVLPIFAFLNAGVSFTGVSWHTAMNPITLGIMGGLFLGKQLGVFAAAWFAVKCGFAQLPQGVNWRWISQQAEYALNVKLGVFVGSIFSGLVGYLFLLALSRSKGR